jgi:outer membrane immunogenic protein
VTDIDSAILGTAMKRLAIALSAVIGLSVGAVQSASAADLPMKAPPMVAAPVFDWTGFYAGASLGGRWSDATWTTSAIGGPDPGPNPFDPADPATNPRGFNSSTVRVGGYLGYNWQVTSQWLVGVEGDLAWGNSKRTLAGYVPGTPVGAINDSSFVKEGWDASIRGRIGFLVAPTWLVYGTGGVAFQDLQVGAGCSGAGNNPATWCSIGTPRNEAASSTRTGWTIGGGVETMLARNWLARVEYRYSDFGTFTHTFFATPATGDAVISGVSLKTQMVLFGAAYKFN